MFTKFGLGLLFFASLFLRVDATIDLNEFHLQLIADELTNDDCQLLIQRLYVSVNKESNSAKSFSCLDKLKEWNDGEGRKETFLLVTAGLKTLGYDNLANRLSKTVFHERSEEVKHYFSSDSFEAKRDENSIIKDGSSRYRLPEKTLFPEAEMQSTPLFSCMQMLTIMFSFLCLLVLIYLILKVCPYVRKHIKSTVRDISTV